MSATAAAASLKDIEKRLMRRWVALRAGWRDRNAAAFEAELIEPLTVKLRTVERALVRVAGIVQQVRRDCD
ncbi:MAG: hypothetical protein D6744_12365 [Planctomycetota bacterium]|nr:MAG: hypothetical protein D6744_12365 [Planctomycetota bacterium]